MKDGKEKLKAPVVPAGFVAFVVPVVEKLKAGVVVAGAVVVGNDKLNPVVPVVLVPPPRLKPVAVVAAGVVVAPAQLKG